MGQPGPRLPSLLQEDPACLTHPKAPIPIHHTGPGPALLGRLGAPVVLLPELPKAVLAAPQLSTSPHPNSALVRRQALCPQLPSVVLPQVNSM